MNNIPQAKLEQLASNTDELINFINEGVRWVDAYEKDDDKALQTNYELKKYRRALKNIREVVTKKTVLSLFGRSQVGKSYLVDGILSTKDEPELEIPDFFTGKTFKFIGAMNPPGGKESTGVVSRFSIEKNDHTQSEHPIEVKLISPKDILLILCDAYYSDIKYYDRTVRDAEITELLGNLNGYRSAQAQPFLSEDDVYDIKDYLDKFRDKSNIIIFNASDYWFRVAENIAYIAPDKWQKVFDILWGYNNRFTELFIALIEDLKALEFSNRVYAEINALLVSGGTILDVQRIKELFSDPLEPVTVETSSGVIKPIKRSKLAALTYEVIIPLKEKLAEEKTFLKNVDVLDFPGARNREVYEEKDIKDLSNDSFFDFYIRGKVSYLFNRYTENYEISSLLFCIDNEQLEVKDIPGLLNNWIKNYIGENIEERTQSLMHFSGSPASQISPLFIIFTKANIMLQYKDVDENGVHDYKSYDYKWDARFKSIFINEYCKGFDWPENWVKVNGKVEKFRNMYLLRNFKHPESIYEGYLENKLEQGISEKRKAYMEGLHESFVNLPFNRDHFHDVERSWSEFTDLNKDGSQYIIQNITPIANNMIRTVRYIDLLNKFKINALKSISSHHRSDKTDDQIKKAASEGSDLQLKMDILFGKDAFYFGSFIESMTLNEREVLEFFHDLLRSDKLIKKQQSNVYILLRAQNKDLDPDKKYQENLEVLRRNYNKSSLEETEKHFQDKEGIDLNELFFGDLYNLQNNSLILAEEARDYWFEQKLSMNHFSTFLELGFDRSMLNQLFENLKLSFIRLKLTHVIAKEIRTYVDVVKRNDRSEDMIAHITAGIINEFITSVGWTYSSAAEKQKVRESNIANQLNLKLPDDSEVFQSLDRIEDTETGNMSVERLIDYMNDLNEKLSQIPIDMDTIQYVPMIKNYQRWSELMKTSFIANCDIPNYNIEHNRQLGEIMQKIDLPQFQID